MTEPADPVDVVRRGYDALSLRYRDDEGSNAPGYRPWIDELLRLLPSGSRVLDLGCGCGVPASRDLAAAGHRVTGVDVSEAQVERARRLVPTAEFLRADATTVTFPPASFDAVVALYSIIHMPMSTQPKVIRAMAGWLTDGGVLLLTAGAQAWTGSERRWLGGDTPMWWSHADGETYRRWLEEAGLTVSRQELVPEGDGGHTLFWARR